MRIRNRALRALTPVGPSHIRPLRTSTSAPVGPSCSRWFSCSCCSKNSTSGTARTTPPHVRTTGDLPLPPCLPYSPDSIPFQRQVAALRERVAHPTVTEEGWNIWHSIHAESRRHVPNDVFLALLNQQLHHAPLQTGDTSEGRRLGRAVSLVQYGLQCGMSIDDIGHPAAVRILILAARRAATEGQHWTKRRLPLFRRLWRDLRKGVEPGDLPPSLRVAWLSVLSRLAELGGNVDHRWNLFCLFINTCGPSGANAEAKKLFDKRLELDRVIWCLKHDLPLDGHICLRAVEAAGDNVDVLSLDPDPRLHQLRAAAAGHAVAMPDVTVQRRRDRQQVVDWMALPARTDDVLATFARELARAPSDCEQFVRRVLHALETAPRDERRSDLVIGVAQHLVSSKLLPDFTDNIATRVLLLVSQQLPSEPAFRLCRDLYSIARAHPQGHRWGDTKRDRAVYRAFSEYAFGPRHQHLRFISRLLVDRRTDGAPIAPSETLDILRAILRSTDPYRFILLERHLRDYVSETVATSADDFVENIAQNMRISEDPEGLLARIVIALRQSLERKILPRVATMLVGRLVENDAEDGAARALDVIDFLPYDIGLAPMYFRVINLLVHRRDMAGAIDAYRRMLRRQIVPETRTIEVLIDGFAAAGNYAEASEMALAAIRSGEHVRPQAVGRLMLRLDRAARTDEARLVESTWRAWGPRVRDTGIQAAKLLMRNQIPVPASPRASSPDVTTRPLNDLNNDGNVSHMDNLNSDNNVNNLNNLKHMDMDNVDEHELKSGRVYIEMERFARELDRLDQTQPGQERDREDTLGG